MTAQLTDKLSDVCPPQRSPHRLSHRDHRIFTRGRRILAHVNLYSVRDRQPPPSQHEISVMCDGLVRIRSKRGSERARDSFLERVAGHFLELRPYRVETLALALADLDREKLEKMPVAVGSTGARSFRAVQQATRDV